MLSSKIVYFFRLPFYRFFNAVSPGIHLIRRKLANNQCSFIRNDNRFYKLKGKYNGSECFIVGNGPSLKVEDLNWLKEKNIPSFGVNKIHLIYPQSEWRPTFYVCEDIPVLETIKDIVNEQKNILKFVMGIPGIKYDRNTIFIKRIASEFTDMNFFEEPVPYLFCGQTVIYLCLQLAMFMGFKKIYLLGIDFSWNFDDADPDEKGFSILKTDSPHFVPNYFKKGEKQYLVTREHFDYMVRILNFAKNIMNAKGIEVFNATRGGKLEVFTRVSMDTLKKRDSRN
ncbi:6-hydroxymethylpterin diphosphokinase MptE-like protein [Leptospira sp. WS39.C2]